LPTTLGQLVVAPSHDTTGDHENDHRDADDVATVT